MSNTKLHPSVMWAQRTDKLYITVNLEDTKDVQVKFEEDKIFFSAKGGPESKEYEVTIELLDKINPTESHYATLARNIPMVVIKDEPKYWSKLLKESKKVHWLKTDFQKWRDEDDSEDEEGDQKDMQFEDMMKQMGNFNTGGPAGDAVGDMADDEDSDDDDLPDLE